MLTIKSPLAIVRQTVSHYRHRQAYRRLLQLPDYLLDDVGFDRREIAEAARGMPLRPSSDVVGRESSPTGRRERTAASLSKALGLSAGRPTGGRRRSSCG